MHAMCHIKDSHSFSLHTMHTNTHKHTNKHTHSHTHTQTHGRCQLCCLLSPGLVHTRIPPAGSTPHCSQSTTWRQLCALSLSLSLSRPRFSSSPNPIPTHSRRFTRAPCHSSGGNRQQLLGIIAQQQRRGERQRGRESAADWESVQESGSVEECGAAAKTFYLCRCRCAFRCGCGSLLMLLPFVKCCLLLQLSMLRSTLQVLLLLPLLLLLLFTCLVPSTFCLLLLVMSSSHAGANREAHTSGSAHGLACSALLCLGICTRIFRLTTCLGVCF